MFKFKILYIFIYFCLFILGCSAGIANIDSTGKNIICFGNSITKGDGSTHGNDFPSLLSKKLDMPVINAGSSGDTTIDALRRIRKDVLERNPRLVIVEFSGNDFLRRIPSKQTFDNLDKIVTMIQKEGAMVVLVVEHTHGYIGGFKRLARKKRALLIPNILKGILFNPELISSDGVHPNNKGYELIADRVYRAIKPLLYR